MYAGYLDPKVGRKENLDSFTPLMNHVLDYNIWAVKADSPYKAVKDVIEAASKAPEQITVTAYGAGGDDHLAILSIQAETSVRLAIVHNRSTAEAKTQVLGGHVQVLGANVSEVAEEVRAGQLRLLGVMAPARSRFLPDAPTFKEQGFNQVWSVSRGIAAPAGMPKDVEAKLIGYLEKTLSSKEHQQKAETLSLEPSVIGGEQYRKFLRDNEQSTKKLMGWVAPPVVRSARWQCAWARCRRWGCLAQCGSRCAKSRRGRRNLRVHRCYRRSCCASPRRTRHQMTI